MSATDRRPGDRGACLSPSRSHQRCTQGCSRPRAPPTPPSSAASHPPAESRGARSWGRRESGEHHPESELPSFLPFRRRDWGNRRRQLGRRGRTLPWSLSRRGRNPIGGAPSPRDISLAPCWYPRWLGSYVLSAHRSQHGQLAVSWRRTNQALSANTTPVPLRYPGMPHGRQPARPSARPGPPGP